MSKLFLQLAALKKLPYAIALTSTTLTLLLWYGLISTSPFDPILKIALHAIVLIADMATQYAK